MRYRRMAIAILTSLAIILACWLELGCSQRECDYNPDTGVWRYKSNSLLTDSSADRITVTTSTGVVVAIEKAYLNNDSITFRFNPITRQIEVVTKGDKE